MEPWGSILTGLTVVATWASLHRRTNGSGPLAKKIDRLEERLNEMCERLARLEAR